ncbi:hypothetical protein [Streptomyces zagrosensis]|uniref:Uncharacterized protein n=1 Tax=Streptomyces zagrosensis TaxID=1042984 RepID=A0A7W9QA31_9ACTN|nr:hypothetical protein [Streptomyces zagrosensis]MBB5936410.1 hypothetical protein [Streptomyces zagrosensis]
MVRCAAGGDLGSTAGHRSTADCDPDIQVLARRDEQPWIVGRCLRPVTVANAQRRTVALIGAHEFDEKRLVKALSFCEICGAALMRWAGSYHAVVATADRTWVYGDACGMRPVFWTRTRIAGVTVFGDHARLLAQAAGKATVDPAHFASHLLGPVPPLALVEAGSSPYEGVRSVPPGSAASVTSGGRVALRRWWTVPDDDLPLAEAGTRRAVPGRRQHSGIPTDPRPWTVVLRAARAAAPARSGLR